MKSYRYIDGEYEVKIEIKRSIFIATVKGELDADEAEEFVKSVRKKYPDANANNYYSDNKILPILFKEFFH